MSKSDLIPWLLNNSECKFKCKIMWSYNLPVISIHQLPVTAAASAAVVSIVLINTLIRNRDWSREKEKQHRQRSAWFLDTAVDTAVDTDRCYWHITSARIDFFFFCVTKTVDRLSFRHLKKKKLTLATSSIFPQLLHLQTFTIFQNSQNAFHLLPLTFSNSSKPAPSQVQNSSFYILSIA